MDGVDFYFSPSEFDIVNEEFLDKAVLGNWTGDQIDGESLKKVLKLDDDYRKMLEEVLVMSAEGISKWSKTAPWIEEIKENKWVGSEEPDELELDEDIFE